MKINSTTVKAPKELVVGIKDTYANEDKNALGETVKDRIATKRTLKVTWVFLTQTEIALILAQTSSVFFTIEYVDTILGTTTKTFTTGEKGSKKSLITRAEVMWDELSMTFEER